MKKILLVEDEAVIAMAEARILEKNGYHVLIAHSGEKAIEKIKEDPAVSLLLMDIDLGKGIDGTEAAQTILETVDIPIVFLSSHTEPEVVEKTEGISSYGYIVKNSGETVMLASIKMAFRLFDAKMKEKEHKAALLHSHEMLSYIIEHNQSAVAVHDKEMNYIYVSQPYLNQYNVKKRDVIGRHHYEVFPDLPEKWRDVHRRALAGEVLKGEEDPYERDDGTIDWTRWECRPWYESDGSIGGIIVYTEVITKERLNKDHIRDNINYIQSILRTTRDGFWVLDLEGNFVDVNEAYCAMTGYRREEMMKLRIPDIDADENPSETAQRMQRIISTGGEIFETRHRRKDGSIFNVEISTSFLGGRESKFICFCRDITDRKEIESRLKENEGKYRELVEDSPVGIFQTNSAGRFVHVNSTMAHMVGAETPEEAVRKFQDLSSQLYVNSVRRGELINELMKHGYADNFDFEAKRLDGEHRWFSMSARISRRYDDGSYLIDGFAIDITKQKVAEEELKRSRNRYKRLLDHSPNLIMEMNIDSREILNCNPAMATNLGASVSDILGKKVDEFLPADTLQNYITIARRSVETGEVQVLESNSGDKFFHTICIPMENDDQTTVQTITWDITERKTNELEQLRARQSLEMILNNIPEDIYIADMEDHRVFFMNEQMKKSFPGARIGDICYEVFRGKSEPCEHCTNARLIGPDGVPADAVVWESNNPINGKWYINYDKAIPWFNGKHVRLQIAADITERRSTKKAAQNERVFLNTVLDNIKDAIVICNQNGKIIRFNESARRLHNLPEEPIPSEQWAEHYDLYHPDGVTPLATEDVPLFRALKGEDVSNAEIVVAPKGKQAHLLSCNGHQLINNENELIGAVIAMHDITEYKLVEEDLRKAVEEKDFLMMELNHRVKNNLNIINSLINLKVNELEEKVDLSDISRQIHAIRLVHEKLYKQEDVTHIDFKEYSQDLLNTIFSSFMKKRVLVENRSQKISIPTRRAVSLGLIINEIATNALKYGFSDNREPVFSLNIETSSDNTENILTVSNTGRPFPEDISMDNPQTLGLRLITALVEQIDGTIQLRREPYPQFTIRFPAGE